jgi:hypothetical protein
MTEQQKLAEVVKSYIGWPARCFYKDKQRVGHINAVKQGPAVKGDNSYEYQNSPFGQVYIDWVEEGTLSCKTFRWSAVTDFTVINPKVQEVYIGMDEPVRVIRSRPLL